MKQFSYYGVQFAQHVGVMESRNAFMDRQRYYTLTRKWFNEMNEGNTNSLRK